MKSLKIFRNWESALVGLLIAEVFLFGAFTPSFLNLDNLFYSTNDFTHIMLAALPLTLVMITSGIDISVASMMGLSSVVLGVFWLSGVNIFVAMGLALLTGILAGMFNGVLVAYSDIQPLVITLGTLFLYSGLATGIAGMQGAESYEGISGLPTSFNNISHGSLGIIPYPLLIVLAFAIILHVLLTRTRFGRSLFLIGVNAEAARFSGVPVRRVIIGAYALSGFGAALAGVMLTSYFTSARSDLGGEALLPIITAVVLGGTSNLGGSGTIAGTLLASLAVGFLKQGLLAVGITNDISQVVIGSLLVVVVAGKLGSAALNQLRINRKALRASEETKGGASSISG